MPLNSRGSVSARFSVRFSAVSAARNAARSLAKTSMPPGSIETQAFLAARTCNDARRLVPASVSTQGAVGKIERCEALRPASFAPRRPPVQAAGNHQVQHQPEVAIHADGDALADAAQFADGAAFAVRERRFDGAQQKRAREPHALERLADDARFERADVGGDIRQFWHAYQLAGGALCFCNLSVLLPTRYLGLRKNCASAPLWRALVQCDPGQKRARESDPARVQALKFSTAVD